MLCKTSRTVICGLLLLTAFFSRNASSAYIEGIDTTDVNGYGLDSAFRINDRSVTIEGQKITYYADFLGDPFGVFNYSFNEIKQAADPVSFHRCFGHYLFDFPKYAHCFVIKKDKDSTYWKVQITDKFADNRYAFKYGTNTSSNNRMLEKSDYDRSILYKPNNFNYCYACYKCISFTWDPPLPNNNHLYGYVIYVCHSAYIDTSLPINLAQWDSVGFTDSTYFSFSFSPYGEYFNIVAEYTEGKSDFLKGWSHLFQPAFVNKTSSAKYLWNTLEIKKTTSGLSFRLPAHTGISSLSICTMAGQQVARFSNIRKGLIFWNTSQQTLAEGLYLVRVELPEGSVINKTLMYTR
jgi:hypothetical protein